MIETVLILALGVSALVLMTGTVVVLGINSNPPLGDEVKINEKEYKARLKQNYDLVYGANTFGLYSRSFHNA
jgi:hypothetical protein